MVASIITAATIKALVGARNIDQILESVPGLHVSRNPIGYNPIYSFRGVHTGFNPQVLMLINNIPITNLFHGDRNLAWGGMPVEAISRIEVLVARVLLSMVPMLLQVLLILSLRAQKRLEQVSLD